MKLEIGSVSCECPHCGAANTIALEMETFSRSYVGQCIECMREYLVTAIDIKARFEGGSCVQCVTAETAKECR